MAKASGYREQRNAPTTGETYGSNTPYVDSDERMRLVVGASQSKEYQALLESWKDCQACPLSATRSSVVFASGKIPADVLFLGEASNAHDDYLGFPGSGPSGRFLLSIIEELRKSRNGWDYAISYPLGCVPWQRPEEGEEPRGYRQPEPLELEKCNPRFLKLLELINPNGIVLMGSLSESYWSTYGTKLQQTIGKRYKIVAIRSMTDLMRGGGARESNVHYRNTLSGLKQFLFHTLDVGKG